MVSVQFNKKSFIGSRSYAAGTVEKVEDHHARRLMEHGAAVAVPESFFALPTAMPASDAPWSQQVEAETAVDPRANARKATVKKIVKN